MTDMNEQLDSYDHYHMNVFGRPLMVLDHGQGSYVWDTAGKKYLDFLAGIAVNSVGYAHPKWTAAVADQAGKIAHTSNYFATVPQIELAEKLLTLAQAPEGSRVYFANSGTEGNEAALKLMKLHAKRKGVSKNARIIALTHAFHGRTLGALSATWKPAIREPFEPLIPNIEFVEAGDVDALTQIFNQGPVAGIIMELIQGEAGVLEVGASFVQKARQLCDDNDALLIIDEVQTGMGRTGHWFAFQNEQLSAGVMPDAITFAKGVAGGFPMGGLITFGQRVSELFTPGSHGSTFAGNPLAARAGLATIGIIEEENLLENATARGIQLREALMNCKNDLFVSVHGSGLLNAIELAHPCAHAAVEWLLNQGLIANAVNPQALRLAPPLNVSSAQIEEGVQILSHIPYDLPND
ncbi:acetylornithine transaminase [Alloscardovia theropitheci]|uniref:Acetylornithine aminotransferase n=1 Tax=Alloscardovia theropitheci TaxID=2496842 RepID=A0A4R0QQI5_9BIFI|nr:acetylornithine transaminase [Alloscardovia theropitheci]TCD53578.1 acetylornithine transaminase [Alloscardovia theropitheci]